MTHLVERCPSCGVEHDHRVHECEACGSAVRHWCRKHSREIGWLETDWCIRCAADEARRMGLPAPTAPPPRPAPPPPPLPTHAGRAAAAAPAETGEGRTAALLRERLREAAEERERAAAAPAPVTVAAPPATPAPPVAAAPGAEPAAEATAPAPPRPGFLLRLYDAFLTVLWTAIVCVAIAGVAGGVWAWRNQELVAYFIGYWGALGGFAGVLIGVIRAIAGFSRQYGGKG